MTRHEVTYSLFQGKTKDVTPVGFDLCRHQLHVPVIPPVSLKRWSESFLSGVHGDVAAQVAAGYEGFAAVGTPELFAVRVDGHVDLQGS